MLWFKNILVYRLNKEIALSMDELEQQLASLAFTPCSSQDMTRTGWVSPMGDRGEALIHVAGKQVMMCARKEDKILPATVIKQALQDKVEKLEGEQGRKLKKTEKATLKDEVVHTLLPRAFSKFSQTFIWLDLEKQLVIVDSGSAKRAEDNLALLRKTLGSLPVVPLNFNESVELKMTEWVRSGELPAGFTLMDEAELKAVLDEGGVIRCKKQELVSDEIATHIEAGKFVTKLSVDWEDRLQFMLCDDGSIKRIKFSETLREQNDDIDKADFAQRFDADFVLMTGELSALIERVTEVLGGEAE
ncbi:recombination-associated protein RdgC [Proteus cibarius]|uniref:Recombination-associated protein RdgC n=1 Tax=Proteus terrae subsp. cibarius TaxID=626774 RepID=A0A6G6SAT9_9GAMM|nr:MULTISPECIES: recombination-associated protein RdgC [Proteus]QHP75373.1 recombination-associated protein RdgC [Proteus vulgaris]MBG2914323.1 recombination-associated protein RdgC [Proteus terrae subsp. cibarius]MBG3089100.1 recombination-associated protein RdgC [Proteus terrae subsp. cibarius]MBG6037665.1 recombination-associated protein RdgC [Proteus terrae subsp. cibarius]MCM2367587.1 recombination-associated protein RdgC [Proteus sp. FZP2095]